jgi:hypothetical protein
MKQIGAEIGVNESRVSQLHARAIRRLREALGEIGPQQAAEVRQALVAFATSKRKMLKAELPAIAKTGTPHAVVLPYKTPDKRALPVRAIVKVDRARRAVAAAR